MYSIGLMLILTDWKVVMVVWMCGCVVDNEHRLKLDLRTPLPKDTVVVAAVVIQVAHQVRVGARLQMVSAGCRDKSGWDGGSRWH